MKIRFTKEVQNHLTGNSLRKPGETMHIRDDYAAGLISMDVAVDASTPTQPGRTVTPAPVAKSYDWTLAGVQRPVSDKMNARGICSPSDLLRYPDLTDIKGIGRVRAKALIKYASDKEIR